MSKTAIAKTEKPSKKAGKSSGDAELPTRTTKPSQSGEKDSKKHKKSRDAEDSAPKPRAAATSVLNMEEKSFPRGGASVLTPIERKQIQIQADRDALFEETGGKKRPAPRDVSDDEDGEEEGDEAQAKPRKKRKTKATRGASKEEAVEKVERIDGLTFKKLVPGSLVLGQVQQITSRDIALALPNHLTGFVPLTSVSRQLTSRVEKLLEDAEKNDDNDEDMEDDFEDVDLNKMFRIGQYLRAAVVSNDEIRGGKHKRRLELSLDPRLTNAGLTLDDLVVKSTVQASVASVEDGGLVMDLGIDGIDAKGFIGANDIGFGTKHSDIEEGTVLLCMVTGYSGNGRVVKLTSDPAKIGDVRKGQSLTNAPSVKTFLPGTAATVQIADITPQGIRGAVMGMLDVTADLVHAGGVQGKQDLEKKYKVGSKVDVRVLYSCPRDDSNRIGVSLVEHVLSLSSKCLANKKGQTPLEQLHMSSTVEEAKVVKVEPRKGIYLDVGIPRVHAFAHISQLSDKQVESISEDIGPYKVGSTHKVRVIGYSSIDGLFSVTLKTSTIEQPFLRMEDVQVGQLVDGTIEDLPIKPQGIAGIRLVLADGIRGFVPVDHISDIKLKHPERKYRVGMKVKARVLSVNVEKRSIYLTMKKALVGAEAEPWTDFVSLKIGDQSPGTITKITPSGAWVQFYADVRGFLPVREMSEAFINDPAEHFRVGQVVNVHIISIDLENKRMLVSCKDPAGLSKDRKVAFDKIQIGQLVDGNIIEIGNELVSLELEAGVQGHLRVEHLTDASEKKNAAALAKMRAGMKLQGLVVLQKIESSRSIRLSNKPSLVKATQKGKLLTSLGQLKKGKEVHGFVSSVTATGVFIEFGDNFSGLIPTSGMPDEMRRLRMQDFGVRVGQSMTAKVWNIYEEDNRFTLTLKDEDDEPQAKDEDSAPKASRSLEHPIDETLESVDDLTLGKQTLARVNAIKDLQVNISLADNVHGRIHATEVFKTFEEIKDPKKPLQTVKHNAVLAVTVTGLHAAKTSKFLPLSHRSSVNPVFECSHKQAGISEPQTLSLLKLKVGQEYIGFVTKYAGRFAIAAISPEVSATVDVAELASVDTEYQKAFPVGCAIRVVVKSVEPEKSKVHVSLLDAKSTDDKVFEEGGIYVGHVRRSHGDGIDVQLSKKVWGFVPLTELTDDYDQARTDKFKAKDVVKVKIISMPEGESRPILSARPSMTNTDSEAQAATIQDRRISRAADLEVNHVIRGFVRSISKQGMLVRIGYNTIAQVPVHELADEYLKNFEKMFKPRQLVKGKIIKVDNGAEGHHKMSLRQSVINNANFKPEVGFADLNMGDVVDGIVVKVEKYGVFVKIEQSKNVRGLCHVGELANTRVEDPSKLYSEGDKVKAKIIKLDKVKRHVNFSLKAVHFQNVDEADEDPEAGAVDEAEEEEEMGGVALGRVREMDSEADDAASGEDEEMADAEEGLAAKKRTSSGGLKTSGFDWTGAGAAEEDDAQQSEAEQEAPKKKRKKAEIQVDRTGDLDAFGPQSVSDFERLLLGQPNSSALWIQYMAFQLQLSEIDKAREIAERALKTIHMREEEQKMNVWVAMLNLENAYGSEESLEAVFERACQMSDKKTVNMRLASIYIDSGKHKEAQSLFESMRKNRDISTDPTYWLNYATFLMSTLNQPESARALLQRATQSLPSHTHSHIISKFGALEFQSPNGDIERGRTVFEGLVDAHKNGHDFWDQYVAQEQSLLSNGRGDAQNIRALFERMAKLKMRPKRAKFVFKKWLAWEKENGNDKQMAKVKALAEEYVENNKGRGGVDL